MSWLAHQVSGCPPSRNSSEVAGAIGPTRATDGATVAVYVVLVPTLTEVGASSGVDVASGPTAIPLAGVAEPWSDA